MNPEPLSSGMSVNKVIADNGENGIKVEDFRLVNNKHSSKIFRSGLLNVKMSTNFESTNLFNVLQETNLNEDMCNTLKNRCFKKNNIAIEVNGLHERSYIPRIRKKKGLKSHTNKLSNVKHHKHASSFVSNVEELPLKNLKVSKKRLKKCRFCGFKKRSCLIDSSGCKARQLNCVKCSKLGHFPKSLNCKFKKKVPEIISSASNRMLPNYLHSKNTRFDITCVQNGTNKEGFFQRSELLVKLEPAEFKDPGQKPSWSDLICQLDGADDISSEEDNLVNKKIFAVNCEVKEILHLINFLRSFNNIWLLSKDHPICDLDKNCLFCSIRSSCVRIRKERTSGPKSLKVSEFTNQLFQLGEDWRAHSRNLKNFIRLTVNLLIKSDLRLSETFLKVHSTQNSQEERIFAEIDIDTKKPSRMSDLVEMVISKFMTNKI